ncbi:MAG: hypothetical protein H0U58_00400 [Chloroflexi bacterium]|nr:hypothetical protein [Chloroflexota bacterium]
MRPVLVINPRRDAEFVAFAEASVAEQMTPEDLERRLRASYPRALVRARGLSAERMTVWYVYRDGQWVAGHPAGENGGP